MSTFCEESNPGDRYRNWRVSFNPHWIYWIDSTHRCRNTETQKHRNTETQKHSNTETQIYKHRYTNTDTETGECHSIPIEYIESTRHTNERKHLQNIQQLFLSIVVYEETIFKRRVSSHWTYWNILICSAGFSQERFRDYPAHLYAMHIMHIYMHYATTFDLNVHNMQCILCTSIYNMHIMHIYMQYILCTSICDAYYAHLYALYNHLWTKCLMNMLDLNVLNYYYLKL